MSNKSYRSEKNATDKGWQAMQEILDREMPVERKRRRAFVILYRLAAVLLPLLGALTWFLSNLGPAAVPVSPADQPVAERTAATPGHPEAVAMNSAETRRNENGKSATPTHPDAGSADWTASGITPDNRNVTPGASKKQPGGESAKDTPPTPKQPAKKGTVSHPIVDGAIAPALHASVEPQPASAPAETAQPVVPVVTPDESPALVTSEPTPAQTAPQTAPSETVMPTAATPAAADTLAQTALALAPPIEPIREKSLHWGASTGALSDVSAQFGGATAGLTLDWKVGEKWGLRSGLAYQYHTLPENDRPLTTVTTATYAEATGDQTIFDNGGFVTTAVDLTAPVYVSVSRLHRIEMPLLAYWQPLPKVRLFGGASLGATAYAEVDDQSFKGYKTFDVKAGTPASNLNSRVSEQVRSLDVRWNVGASFRATRSIELGLFFQSPIRALSDTSWLAADTGASTPSNINPSLEKLATERQTTANGRALFQFLATVFF